MDQTYPEPFAEALSYSSKRAAQITSLFIALTQAFAQYRARRQHEQVAHDQAAATQAARFVRKFPTRPGTPDDSWINPPEKKEAAAAQ